MGGLVFNEQFQKYGRRYDEAFRTQYIAGLRQQEQQALERKQREKDAIEDIMAEGKRREMLEKIATQTQDGTEYDLSHPRRGEAGKLSQEDIPNRYSQMI